MTANLNYPNSDVLIWIHIIWNCIWTWVRIMLLFTLQTKTILYTGDSLSQSLNVILIEVILTSGVKLQSRWPHWKNLSRIFVYFNIQAWIVWKIYYFLMLADCIKPSRRSCVKDPCFNECLLKFIFQATVRSTSQSSWLWWRARWRTQTARRRSARLSESLTRFVTVYFPLLITTG